MHDNVETGTSIGAGNGRPLRQQEDTMSTPAPQQRPDALAAARKITHMEAARRERAAAAIAAIVERMPDLCDDRGRPCPFAVEAYLRLKGASDRTITPAAVRDERRKRLDWHRERWGYDPTELAEEEVAPAGHLATQAGERAAQDAA